MDSEDILRWLTGLLSLAWAVLHITVGYNAATLASKAIGEPSLVFAIYSEYFGFNAALYIFAGYEIISGTRKLLIPFTILFVWNTALLIESHIAPAPILGKTLPIIPLVFPVLALDFLLVGSTILTWWKSSVRV
jgi:hypothetical protein